MGMLANGRWTATDTAIRNGYFTRTKSVFAAPVDESDIAALAAQPGRYHLIASRSCPWSQRALFVRALKRLESWVPLHIAGGPRVEGYALADAVPWRIPGTSAEIRHLHELYTLACPDYSGRATVPVLWDSHAHRIISNESIRIMRAFDAVQTHHRHAFTLTPPSSRTAMATLDEQLYENLFNAVYRAGFTQRQAIHDRAVDQVFRTLDALEQRLDQQRYLFGATVTATDWCLLATLLRFDAVYHIHFKCTRRRLVDYPNLWAWARDLYAWRGIAETVDFDAIRDGYYANDLDINPFGIVAAQPEADWAAAHDRGRFGAARVALVRGGEIEVDTATLEPLSGGTRCRR